MEDGLQDDFGFAEAGVEIEMERIEAAPGEVGIGGEAVGDIGSSFEELVVDALDRFGEDAELVEETRTLCKKDGVEDAVPRGRALAGIAAKEFGTEGIHKRNFGKMAAGERKRLTAKNQLARNAPHEFRGDTNLLPSANQLAAGAIRESVLESNTEHSVAGFPAHDDGFEEAVFVARQTGKPGRRHTTLRRRGNRPPPRKHPKTPQILTEYTTEKQVAREFRKRDAPRKC